MDLSHPAVDLFGENEARIFHRLAVLAEGGTGRRIHELSGVKALRTTQSILERLARIGLVDVRPVGPANQYTLNRGHLLWAPIELVLATPARLESDIVAIMSQTFTGNMAGAALYGSFARGDAGPDSDVDILLVWAADAPATGRAELIDQAGERIRRLTGNPVQILPVTETELGTLVDAGDPLVESLRADARPLTDGFNLTRVLQKAHEARE